MKNYLVLLVFLSFSSQATEISLSASSILSGDSSVVSRAQGLSIGIGGYSDALEYGASLTDRRGSDSAHGGSAELYAGYRVLHWNAIAASVGGKIGYERISRHEPSPLLNVDVNSVPTKIPADPYASYEAYGGYAAPYISASWAVSSGLGIALSVERRFSALSIKSDYPDTAVCFDLSGLTCVNYSYAVGRLYDSRQASGALESALEEGVVYALSVRYEL